MGSWSGHCGTQHTTFNEEAAAAPVFPWRAMSNWYCHIFVTSFWHCKMNIPSCSSPSPLQRLSNLRTSSEGSCALHCHHTSPFLSCHPADCQWGAGSSSGVGSCQPCLGLLSLEAPDLCSHSHFFQAIFKLQADLQVLHPKHPGDFAMVHFFYIAKPNFLLPLSNLSLAAHPCCGVVRQLMSGTKLNK